MIFQLVLLSTLIGHSTFKNENSSPHNVKIVFRCDDFFLEPTPLNDKIIYEFKKYKIPVSLGIIPYDTFGVPFNNLDSKRLTTLKSMIKKNEIEIMLHGYNHLNNNLNGGYFQKEFKSEFRSESFDIQFSKISRAKKTLDSLLNIDVIIFVPPFDSYDDNTLKVLDSLNFKIISSDMAGSSASKKIVYIPKTTEEIELLPSMIMKYRNDDVVIVFLFHPYLFKESENHIGYDYSQKISFTEFDSILSWVSKQSYVTSYTFTNLATAENFDCNRYNANAARYNLFISIAHKLRLFRYAVYSSVSYEKQYKFILISANLLFHIVTLLLTYYVSRFLATKMKRQIIRLFVTGLFIILIISIINYYHPMWMIINIFLLMNLVVSIIGINTGLKTVKVKRQNPILIRNREIMVFYRGLKRKMRLLLQPRF